MRPRGYVIAGVIAVVVAIAIWKCKGSSSDSAGGTSGGSNARGSATSIASRPPVDPKTLARASISGTITAEAGGPVAKARVCAVGSSEVLPAELLRDHTCTLTDDTGDYQLANLLPAKYVVSAAAKPLRPGVYHPGGDPKRTELAVNGGERKTGIDIALRAGGVEITGVVSDLTGGPIANARVWGRKGGMDSDKPLATTETDAEGRFVLWTAPGSIYVVAAAEGYTTTLEFVQAPGKLELLLTPESSLAGRVVDATTNAPIAGARVTVDGQEWTPGRDRSVTTDAQGAFRIDRLKPGRYATEAVTEGGYGRSEGSTLVGLGQHADGVVVKLWPARRLEGKVIVSSTKASCEHPDVWFVKEGRESWDSARHRDDGVLFIDGLRPGTYKVNVVCRGFVSRDRYEPITIADKDITGLVWEVDPGATVRGRVATKAGDAVEGADIWARTIGGAARGKAGSGGTQSDREGRYVIEGLRPGTYKITVEAERGIGPKDGFEVVVPAGATVDRDLVLDASGSIQGSVVDSDGKPVADISVIAMSLTTPGGEDAKTDDAGNFTIHNLRPGEYQVVARRAWVDQLRKPGTTDDAKQFERATVRASQQVTVRIIVESQSAMIKGSVVGADGKPVADAFVSAARESDAAGSQRTAVNATRWSWDLRQVITATDGAFTIGKLSPGSYTVRAFRKGGGEAIAEHVATGSTAKLLIKPVGSIEGVVRRSGGVPIELEIQINDPKTGFTREENFFHTDGRFVVRDLPAGHFEVLAESDGGLKKVEVDLGDGHAKTGIVIELEALVSVSGRLVEMGTQKPVPGIRMMASLASGGGFKLNFDEDGAHITDEAGRFTISHVPSGKLMIRGWPKDRDGDYSITTALKNVEGSGTIDIGDIGILKRRVKRGEPIGELGVKFAEQPPDTAPDKRERKVSFIDPTGPAAKSGLQVGDVVVSVDGTDIRGENYTNGSTLLRAAPGTKLALGLARNATVTITLVPP